MKNFKKMLLLLVTAIFSLTIVPTAVLAAGAGAEIYVSNDGDDSNDGSLSNPFKTIEKAKEKARELKKTVTGGEITVYLRGGDYPQLKTLEFTEEDSGSMDCPITYKAYNKELVNIIGGRRLEGSLWKIADSEDSYRIPAEAQGKVYQVDLNELGYTKEQIGKMNYLGAYSEYDPNEPRQANTEELPPAVELFDDSKPMIRARYPNFDNYIYVKKVVKNSVQWYYDQSDPSGWTIEYEDTHLDRWANAKHPKIFGFFTYDWADATVDIANIDTRKRTITSHAATAFGIKPADGIGGRYYGFDMLEELDDPGEYYIDPDTLILYYYPNTTIEESKIEISVLTEDLIVFNKCSYINFKDLNISTNRFSIVRFQESKYCTIDGCSIYNSAKYLVDFRESENCTLKNSELFNSGSEAITMFGYHGMKNLEKTNNSVINCKIHDYARLRLMSAPAIMMKGCGHYAGYNEIYNGKNTGIFLHEAVMCTIEYNNIHHVLSDTSDAGIIYWGLFHHIQDIVIRYNYLHHCGQGQVNLVGVYADGGAGGATVYGNVITDLPVGTGVQSFGSNMNIQNNVFVDMSRQACHLWYETSMIGIQESQPQTTVPFGENDFDYDVRTAAWKNKYPFLVDQLSRPAESFYIPINNTAKNNITINGGGDVTNDVWKQNAQEYNPTITVTNTQVAYNYDDDLNITLDQEAIKKSIPDWQDIPIDKIGPSGIVGNVNFEMSEDYGGNRIGDTESLVKPTENDQVNTDIKQDEQVDERIKNAVALAIETPKTYVNGEMKKIDDENDKVVPVIKKGRTLLPVRFIAETFGFDVQWNDTLREVTLTKDDKIVKMKINENILNINGVDNKMDTAATIVEGRTMIPLRALCESVLSKQVFWDPKGLIVISDTQNIFDSVSDSETIAKIITNLKK